MCLKSLQYVETYSYLESKSRYNTYFHFSHLSNKQEKMSYQDKRLWRNNNDSFYNFLEHRNSTYLFFLKRKFSIKLNSLVHKNLFNGGVTSIKWHLSSHPSSIQSQTFLPHLTQPDKLIYLIYEGLAIYFHLLSWTFLLLHHILEMDWFWPKKPLIP